MNRAGSWPGGPHTAPPASRTWRRDQRGLLDAISQDVAGVVDPPSRTAVAVLDQSASTGQAHEAVRAAGSQSERMAQDLGNLVPLV